MTETGSNAAATTTTRGAHLADQLDAINDKVIAAVAACTDEQWRRPTAAEGWPVGVVAHHIAEVQRFFGGILGPVAAGEVQPATLSAVAVDENNARHARDHAGVGKDETLAALRSSGPETARLLRALDDARIDAVVVVFDGHGLTVAQTVELALVGHFEEHLASIQATQAA